LVLEQIDCERLSATKIVESIRLEKSTNQSPCQSLDRLVTASGLSAEICAKLLLIERIIDEPIDRDQVAATQDARLFWTLYAEGRGLREAKVARENYPRWRGNFAFFTRERLAALLPGVILPDHYRRLEFVTNYVTEPNGGACLDLYNADGVPLVRHPFSRE
jgi:hypothetical protein